MVSTLILAAVARALRPGTHDAPVAALLGPQGIGKSALLEALFGTSHTQVTGDDDERIAAAWRDRPDGAQAQHALDVANATIAQLRAAIEARDAAVREYLVSSDAIVRLDAGEPCTVAEAEAMLARWRAARTALVALTGGAA